MAEKDSRKDARTGKPKNKTGVLPTWTVKITGLVTYRKGRGRAVSPTGNYVMTEVRAGDLDALFELRYWTGLTFNLSLREVALYRARGLLRFPDADWP